MRRAEAIAGGLLALVLIAGSVTGRLPLPLTEVFGFLTGLLCVRLVVARNIWNFPVGVANNAFFAVLFFEARLFADAGLQVVFAGLGVAGWYWWLNGGRARTRLTVGRASPRMLLLLGVCCAVATFVLMRLLEIANGAAPFLDALTTALSLSAQFLLNRKLIESWYVWIAADVLYVGLFINRGLYLTAGLYAVFLGLCIAGLIGWRRALSADRPAPGPTPEPVLRV